MTIPASCDSKALFKVCRSRVCLTGPREPIHRERSRPTTTTTTKALHKKFLVNFSYLNFFFMCAVRGLFFPICLLSNCLQTRPFNKVSKEFLERQHKNANNNLLDLTQQKRKLYNEQEFIFFLILSRYRC